MPCTGPPTTVMRLWRRFKQLQTWKIYTFIQQKASAGVQSTLMTKGRLCSCNRRRATRCALTCPQGRAFEVLHTGTEGRPVVTEGHLRNLAFNTAPLDGTRRKKLQIPKKQNCGLIWQSQQCVSRLLL